MNEEDLIKFKEMLKKCTGSRPHRAILSGEAIYDYEIIKRLDDMGADIEYYYGDDEDEE